MGRITTDLKTGLAFCTRLPVSAPKDVPVGEAAWTFPVAGAVVGLFGGGVLAAGFALGLPPLVAATLGVGATAFVTGCLHEDGLADVADGFGGGRTQERVKEIMRDSRIGTYGVVALVLSFLLRAGALASLLDAGAGTAALALVGAHAGARGFLPVFMRALPQARREGLSAEAGKPSEGTALSALALGLAIMAFSIGFGLMLAAAILVAILLVVLGRMSMRKAGGQTGDVLGTAEQLAEIAILLIAAAWL